MRADHEIIINVIRCNHGSSKFNYCIPYFTFCCFSIIIILKCNDDIRRIAKKVLTMIDLSHMIQDMTDTITRTNPFSGVSVELTMEEAVRYDQIKEDEVNENYGRMQSGLTWFQKNNVDAYYKLLD